MPTLRKLLTAKVVTPIGYILHMDTTYVFSMKAVDREGPKLPFLPASSLTLLLLEVYLLFTPKGNWIIEG